MSIETLEKLDIVESPYEEPAKEGEGKAHIVNPPNNLHIWRIGMTTQDIVDIARVRGLEVVALCGYRWIPRKDPDAYPACEACFKIAQLLMASNGE